MVNLWDWRVCIFQHDDGGDDDDGDDDDDGVGGGDEKENQIGDWGVRGSRNKAYLHEGNFDHQVLMIFGFLWQLLIIKANKYSKSM